MDKNELRLDYSVYRNSFPEEYRNLCEEAIKATDRSYSIYSRKMWLTPAELVRNVRCCFMPAPLIPMSV